MAGGAPATASFFKNPYKTTLNILKYCIFRTLFVVIYVSFGVYYYTFFISLVKTNN